MMPIIEGFKGYLGPVLCPSACLLGIGGIHIDVLGVTSEHDNPIREGRFPGLTNTVVLKTLTDREHRVGDAEGNL